MPRKRIAGKVRRGYTDSDRVQLRTGHNFFNDSSFGDLRVYDPATGEYRERPEALRAMRLAWAELKAEVMARDRDHHGLYHRPWGWWVFEQKLIDPPRDPHEQRDYLLGHPELLSEEEKAALILERNQHASTTNS
jgi:hypothetical protein